MENIENMENMENSYAGSLLGGGKAGTEVTETSVKNERINNEY